MSMSTLHDLLIDEIKDLYSAEKQMMKALPKMVKAAMSPTLKKAFTNHLTQTQVHIVRLETVCEELGCKPSGKKCKAMEGLVAEGSEVIGEDGDRAVKDAALVGAAQRVEHYEIAAYGTAHAFAESLGLGTVARLLKQTLDEEMKADALLTQIAVNEVNPAARNVAGDEGDDADADDEAGDDAMDHMEEMDDEESGVLARDRDDS